MPGLVVTEGAGVRSERCSLGSVLGLGISVGLCTAFLDVMIAVLGEPQSLAQAKRLIPYATITSVSLLAVYVIAWLAIGWPIARLCRLNRFATAMAMAVFFVSFFALSSLLGLVQVTVFLEAPGPSFTRLLLALGLACTPSVLFYVAATSSAIKGRSRWVFTALLGSLPFLFMELGLFIWLVTYAASSISFLQFLLCFAGLMTALVGTVALLALIQRSISVLVMHSATLALLVLGTSLIVVRAGPSKTAATASPGSVSGVRHVIFVLVDTLRQNELTCYNAAGLPTPNMDSVARDGIVFRNAYSTSGWTLPAMAAIMTGLTPDIHLVLDGYSRLSEQFVSLSERLRAAGYMTGAIGNNTLLTPGRGFEQGFDHYDFYPKKAIDKSTFAGKVLARLMPDRFKTWITTPEITDLACDWLAENRGAPLFLWLHYYDPHTPYTPSAAYVDKGQLCPPFQSAFDSTEYTERIRAGRFVPNTNQRAAIKALYDGEVRDVDASLGVLLGRLKDLGMYDDSLIILTSDHGEEFWEHHGFEHGHTLYDELVRVPLILKMPAKTVSGDRLASVSTVDILPTVLDLCGIEYRPEELSGSSFAPLLTHHADAFEARPLYARGVYAYEDREWIVAEGMKYIRFVESGREELYDLVADPREQESLVERDTPRLDRFRVLLDEHRDTATRLRGLYGASGDAGEKIDAETIDALKAIGYLE